MSTTLLSPTTGSAPAASVKDLAGAAKADRNRAIDLYRALAMLAVSIGHWAAIVMTTDADGELVTGNALEFAPSMSWLTWILQVMPLFFVVGGFSSAMSLDSHNAKGGRPQDWVAARLRRMLAPVDPPKVEADLYRYLKPILDVIRSLARLVTSVAQAARRQHVSRGLVDSAIDAVNFSKISN